MKKYNAVNWELQASEAAKRLEGYGTIYGGILLNDLFGILSDTIIKCSDLISSDNTQANKTMGQVITMFHVVRDHIPSTLFEDIEIVSYHLSQK